MGSFQAAGAAETAATLTFTNEPVADGRPAGAATAVSTSSSTGEPIAAAAPCGVVEGRERRAIAAARRAADAGVDAAFLNDEPAVR